MTGSFIPFDSPGNVTVDASVDGLHHEYEAPGQVEFEYQDVTHRLTVFAVHGGFEILFRDSTSGVTTYGASREMLVDTPNGHGHVTLDFNRATNPFCAYTDFATCPLPPPENRLSVAIEAGEKIP